MKCCARAVAFNHPAAFDDLLEGEEAALAAGELGPEDTEAARRSRSCSPPSGPGADMRGSYAVCTLCTLCTLCTFCTLCTLCTRCTFCTLCTLCTAKHDANLLICTLVG